MNIRWHRPDREVGSATDVLTRLGEALSFDSVDAETKRAEGIAVRVAALRQRFGLEAGD